jgi:hypothetical protein
VAYVVNRPGFDPKPYNEAAANNAPQGFEGFAPRWLLHGPDFGFVVEREQVIRGRVTDAETGEGRPSVHVVLARSGNALLPVPVGAWTDADGRYEIRGARKAKSYLVEVSGDPATGHVAAQAGAEDTPGYAPVTLDVRVKKGVVLTGRLLDGSTGKPLRGYVLAPPLVDNPFVKDYPEFGVSAWFDGGEAAEDGTFRVATLPGPVLLMGMPRTAAEMARYKRPVADPKYPKYFKKLGDHTVFYGPGGLTVPLQGNFAKVLELKPGAKVVTHDVVFEPAR